MGLNLIQTGRFNRLFQKLFSMKGGANITEVGAEILPTISIRIGSEVRYLEGWQRFGCAFDTGTATTTNVVAARFRNPAGSNVLAVIEKILLTNKIAETSMSVTLAATAADLLNNAASTNGRLDQRGQPNSAMSTGTSANAGGTLGTSILFLATVAVTPIDLILSESHELTVLPGDAVTLWPVALLQRMLVGMFWRERAMEESELK